MTESDDSLFSQKGVKMKMPKNSFRVSLFQMEVLLGKTEENFSKAERGVLSLSRESDAVLLPETWNTGFFPQDLKQSADENGMRTRRLFSSLAEKEKVNVIAGSTAVSEEGKIFNRSFVFNREGREIAHYDKVHLFSPMGEDKAFCAGSAPCVFELDGHRCGVITCYDLRFPEWTRLLALRGIKILFVPCQWPFARKEQMRLLARSRAIENQIFLVLCNAVGSNGKTEFGGSSLIVDPFGNILAEAGREETCLSALLDFSVIEKARSAIPVFSDRREDIY